MKASSPEVQEIWSLIKETQQSIKETNRELRQSIKETSREQGLFVNQSDRGAPALSIQKDLI